MFYAIRTQTVDNYSETQALRFYTKGDRDEYINMIGGKAITAKEYKKLSFAGTEHGAINKEVGCIFFWKIVFPL